MDHDSFINDAIARGSQEGVSSLDADQRLVFLISEAEVDCDVNGIDTFIDHYAPAWIEETAAAFHCVGAIAIATAFRAFMTNASDRDAIFDRLNTLIAERTGYNYESIAGALTRRNRDASDIP